jgi:hypothetical protein
MVGVASQVAWPPIKCTHSSRADQLVLNNSGIKLCMCVWGGYVCVCVRACMRV